MNGAFLTGIIGLLGVILGWALTWWTNWWQERKRETQVRRGVRLLLRLECKQNLAALSDFWSKVASEGVHLPGVGVLGGVSYSMDEGEFDKRQRLAGEPLPAWRRLMWESQAGMAAMALTPTEIDRVYTLYSDLGTLTTRRAELREAFDTPEGKKLAEDYSQWMQQKQQGRPTTGTSQYERDIEAALGRFNGKTRTLWSECKAICERALPYKDSNLIEEDVPPG